jgi:hypothetical protein
MGNDVSAAIAALRGTAVKIGLDSLLDQKSRQTYNPLEQANKLLACNDRRIDDLVDDLGGAVVCARTYAAIWLAITDGITGANR